VIDFTARALAKISPELDPIDQKDLAGRLGSMPDEIIAKITEFKEASIEPHRDRPILCVYLSLKNLKVVTG